MPHTAPSLPYLAKFLNSFLTPKQIDEFIALLGGGSGDQSNILSHDHAAVLDPEAISPQLAVTKPAPTLDQPAATQSIDALLQEMEAAYSIEKFTPLTADESRRVRDSFPGFIERCSANQGRHLVKMLREKLQEMSPTSK